MTIRRLCLATILSAAALAALPASAAVQRTFVASFGLDTNPCSITSPCRTFAAAMANTLANGEVIVLDSAGYGAFTITQSVSIIAPDGVYAGISVFSGDGITIGAGPLDKVVLRGLTINGQGGTHGIRIAGGLEVHVERCVVSNMGGEGIRIEASVSLHVRDTLLRSNTLGGINLASGIPAVHVSDTEVASNPNPGISQSVGTLVLERVKTEGVTRGLGVTPAAGTTVRTAVRDSQFSGLNGVDVFTEAGKTALVTIDRSGAWPSNGTAYSANSITGGSITLVINDSVGSGNNSGVNAFGAGTRIEINRSALTRNSILGVQAAFGATVLISGSSITRNATWGIVAVDTGTSITVSGSTLSGNGRAFELTAPAVLNTCGDNRVFGNTNANIGSMTPISCTQ